MYQLRFPQRRYLAIGKPSAQTELSTAARGLKRERSQMILFNRLLSSKKQAAGRIPPA